MKHIFDPVAARVCLDAGIAHTDWLITPAQRDALMAYLTLMAKWNPVYNLTAIRETDKMVRQHLLDSLAIVPLMREWVNAARGAEPARVLDVGTGGGLPGVVLAILHPDWQLTLIDPVHKKTAFLTQVKAQLNLHNLRVVTGKVEDLPTHDTHHVITSRAFASVLDFVRLSQAVLAPNGCFAAMKGVFPTEELSELQQAFGAQWQVQSHDIVVPQLDAQRCLLQLTPTTHKA